MEEIKNFFKLTLPAHEALPEASVSELLCNSGININEFCRKFNEATKDMKGNLKIGIVIYKDFSFDILSPEDIAKFDQLKKIDYTSISEKEYNFFKKLNII